MQKRISHKLAIVVVAGAVASGGCVDFVVDGLTAGLTAGIADVFETTLDAAAQELADEITNGG